MTTSRPCATCGNDPRTFDIDGEGWSLDELRAAIEQPHCAKNHHPDLPRHAITDIHRRFRAGEPVWRLASEHRVSKRTVYRYLRYRLPCPGERCLTTTRGGVLCRFCVGSAERRVA